MRAHSCHLVVAAIVVSGGAARADTHVTLRTGVVPLALEATTDTPIIGGYFDDAVMAYNAAAAAYDRAHRGSRTAAIDRSALGVHDTLVTFTPGLEVGGDRVALRLEAILGVGDSHHAFGVGVYPIDVTIARGTIAPYVVAGGSACWLDRTDVDGGDSIGGLVAARVAAGARVGSRVAIEIGYDAIVVGGLVDTAQLHSMMHYDPSGSAPPPPADHAVSGGEQHGMIDVSIGVQM